MITDEKEMFVAVRDLLRTYAVTAHAAYELAPHVANASLMMGHMYADLGFESRTQMGKFMKTHYPKLAAMKPKNKLWKKYIYEVIDSVAPACATCNDQLTCFTCLSQEMSA